MSIHGTLVVVEGLGVLLVGPSGIGKSECALELIRRGHRLVADDVVEVVADADGGAIGRAPAHMGHHMEIRGLGIVSIPELFGAEAVERQAHIGLACRLQRSAEDLDRLGLDRPPFELGSVQVPSVALPASAGAILATLVEVAVRDLRLRERGVNAAARFDAALRARMAGG